MCFKIRSSNWFLKQFFDREQFCQSINWALRVFFDAKYSITVQFIWNLFWSIREESNSNCIIGGFKVFLWILLCWCIQFVIDPNLASYLIYVLTQPNSKWMLNLKLLVGKLVISDVYHTEGASIHLRSMSIEIISRYKRNM